MLQRPQLTNDAGPQSGSQQRPPKGWRKGKFHLKCSMQGFFPLLEIPYEKDLQLMDLP